MSRLKDILGREPVFINPYTDFGFKRLFGDESSKDLLIDFLNQILPKRHQIRDLTFQNVEQIPALENERKAFFDIRCHSKTGETFIVEMQKNPLEYFHDRAVYYLTFPIQQQAKKGEWDFQLKPTYLIALLDFQYDAAMKRQLILRKIAFKDQFGELFSDKVHLRFIQMPLFTKKESELKTRFDKWLFFLQNLESFDDIPQILNEPIFQKGFEKAKIAKMNTQEYNQYETSRMIYLENKGVIDTAHKKGKIEGKIEGKVEGAVEHTELVIKECIERGFSIELTAQLAVTTIEFVLDVIKKYQLKTKPPQ